MVAIAQGVSKTLCFKSTKWIDCDKWCQQANTKGPKNTSIEWISTLSMALHFSSVRHTDCHEDSLKIVCCNRTVNVTLAQLFTSLKLIWGKFCFRHFLAFAIGSSLFSMQWRVGRYWSVSNPTAFWKKATKRPSPKNASNAILPPSSAFQNLDLVL